MEIVVFLVLFETGNPAIMLREDTSAEEGGHSFCLQQERTRHHFY